MDLAQRIQIPLDYLEKETIPARWTIKLHFADYSILHLIRQYPILLAIRRLCRTCRHNGPRDVIR